MLPCYFLLCSTCLYSPYHSCLSHYTIILLFRGFFAVGGVREGGRGGGVGLAVGGDWLTTNFLISL